MQKKIKLIKYSIKHVTPSVKMPGVSFALE
jgi:hypothetical protein